jgi:hypothetical protein
MTDGPTASVKWTGGWIGRQALWWRGGGRIQLHRRDVWAKRERGTWRASSGENAGPVGVFFEAVALCVGCASAAEEIDGAQSGRAYGIRGVLRRTDVCAFGLVWSTRTKGRKGNRSIYRSLCRKREGINSGPHGAL